MLFIPNGGGLFACPAHRIGGLGLRSALLAVIH
jgi:hypothetical protein